MYTYMKYTYTGWRRPIGCLKLQVIFRKSATNYKVLLWKMTYQDEASYDSTPSCRLLLLLPAQDVIIYILVLIALCTCETKKS